MLIRTLLALTVIHWALIARADTPGSSTHPSTQSSVEESSPRSTALQMNLAMRAFDEQSMLNLMYTATQEQKAYARAAAQSDAYVARLLAASEEKFGKESVAKVQDAVSDISDDDIRAAEEVRDGERARLVGKNGKFTFQYVLKDGRWKIDVPAAFDDTQVPIQYFTDDTYRRGNWTKVVAQDVAIGKYKTLDELLSDIAKRFPKREEEPTTQPRP